MAISAGAVVRKFGAWLTTDQPTGNTVDPRPVQPTATDAPRTGWGARDQWEGQQALRTRKAGLELMKFQGISRGY